MAFNEANNNFFGRLESDFKSCEITWKIKTEHQRNRIMKNQNT